MFPKVQSTRSSALTEFALADDDGMLLLDWKDLRAILGFVADNAKAISKTYGNIAAASVGAV